MRAVWQEYNLWIGDANATGWQFVVHKSGQGGIGTSVQSTKTYKYRSSAVRAGLKVLQELVLEKAGE